jgi:hypothetical protein
MIIANKKWSIGKYVRVLNYGQNPILRKPISHSWLFSIRFCKCEGSAFKKNSEIIANGRINEAGLTSAKIFGLILARGLISHFELWKTAN